MAFFSKLKERLFKSSSKIDEGLEAIVEDGGVEEDVAADISHGIEKGIAIATPIGAIAGMAIMVFAIPGAGLLGVGGMLAAGGIPGALAGTYFGALLGLATEEHELDEETDWERVPLEFGQVLVVVAGHDHPDEVADILRRNKGDLVSKPPHLG